MKNQYFLSWWYDNLIDILMPLKLKYFFLIFGPKWIEKYIFSIKGWNLKNYHFDAIGILEFKSIFFSKTRDELSQKVLDKIAFTHFNHSLRSYATERVKSKEILVKLAFEDTSTFVREAAVKKIQDNDILYKIILTDRASEVRRVSLFRLNDQKILESLSLNCKDHELRCVATSKLINESIHRRLLATDNDCEIRIICVKKIRSMDALIDHLFIEKEKRVIYVILQIFLSQITLDNSFALKIPAIVVNRLLQEEMINFYDIDFLDKISLFLEFVQVFGYFTPTIDQQVMMSKISFEIKKLSYEKDKMDQLRKMGLLKQRTGYWDQQGRHV